MGEPLVLYNNEQQLYYQNRKEKAVKVTKKLTRHTYSYPKLVRPHRTRPPRVNMNTDRVPTLCLTCISLLIFILYFIKVGNFYNHYFVYLYELAKASRGAGTQLSLSATVF